MCDYWFTRYTETLSQAQKATSPKVRAAYLQLADHYRAMHRICGRKANKDYRLAA